VFEPRTAHGPRQTVSVTGGASCLHRQSAFVVRLDAVRELEQVAEHLAQEICFVA
jgi:hypothetical protein